MRARAFTLMELIIVVVIVGIIAAFAIPSYEKAMARQKAKRLILTAHLMIGAQKIYKARNGRYWCNSTSPECDQLSEINTNLKINIMPEDEVYQTYATPPTYDDFFSIVIMKNS